MAPSKPKNKIMSFDERFDLLKKRYDEHGITEFFKHEGDGLMNIWLLNIRRAYKKLKKGKKATQVNLTPERIAAFDEMDFDWKFKPGKHAHKLLKNTHNLPRLKIISKNCIWRILRIS